MWLTNLSSFFCTLNWFLAQSPSTSPSPPHIHIRPITHSFINIFNLQLSWRCSVCRRKMSSRVCLPQDSTDSLLDVPMLDTLQRRHSDVKIGSSSQQLSSGGGLNLVPPKNSEYRRHSDVSPASLKELEKVRLTFSFFNPYFDSIKLLISMNYFFLQIDF